MLYDPSKLSPMNIKDLYDSSSLPEKEQRTPFTISPAHSEQTKGKKSPNAFFSKLRYAKHAPTSILGLLMPHHNVITPENNSRPKLVERMFMPSPMTSQASSDEEDSQASSLARREPRSCLVYLIRHGEASHNVLEKKAKQRAKEEAEAEGLSPREVAERMEEARKAVLVDESLRDAQLSENGRQDAIQARETLERLTKERRWNMPRKVLVSPLTRTLETADLIFPHHDSICVHEEIQERQTGKPCDSRQSASKLSTSFQRFRMNAMTSFQDDAIFCSDDDDDDDSDARSPSTTAFATEKIRADTLRWNSEGHERDEECQSSPDCRRGQQRRTLSDPLGPLQEEDKMELRRRTRKLLGLLDEPSIAVVTHKGYLRELERGTLGRPDAKEFGNGEIRVYRIHLDADQELEHAERVV